MANRRLKLAPVDERVGQLVRKLRLSRGWSQEELARRMTTEQRKWHQTTVGKVEGGARPLTFAEAIDLATVFDVEVSDLFSNDEGSLITEVGRRVRECLQLEEHRDLALVQVTFYGERLAEGLQNLRSMSEEIDTLRVVDPLLASQLADLLQRVDAEEVAAIGVGSNLASRMDELKTGANSHSQRSGGADGKH